MVYCSCSLVSKIYQIYHRSSLFPSQYTSGGSRGWVRGPVPPSYFLTKMRPEGPKKFFWRPPPPLPSPPSSEGLDLPLQQHTIYQPNLVSGQVGYEELAGGFKPIRNGKIF